MLKNHPKIKTASASDAASSSSSKRQTNPAAFTVIELIIVIAIIAVLTIIGIDVFRSSQQQIRHNNVVSKVMQMIQKARNLAINSQLYNYDYPATSDNDPDIVPAGYGIHFYRPHDEIIELVPPVYNIFSGYGGSTDPSENPVDTTVTREPAEVILFVDNRFTGTSGCYDNPIPHEGDAIFREVEDEIAPLTENDFYHAAFAAGPPIWSYCISAVPFEDDYEIETFTFPRETKLSYNSFHVLNIIFKPPFGDVQMYKNFQSHTAGSRHMESTGYYHTDGNTARIDIQTGPYTDSIFINRLSGMPFQYEPEP